MSKRLYSEATFDMSKKSRISNRAFSSFFFILREICQNLSGILERLADSIERIGRARERTPINARPSTLPGGAERSDAPQWSLHDAERFVLFFILLDGVVTACPELGDSAVLFPRRQ